MNFILQTKFQFSLIVSKLTNNFTVVQELIIDNHISFSEKRRNKIVL